MKIMYIHGFGSHFQGDSEKLAPLKKLGDLLGCSYDYTADPDSIRKTLLEFAVSMNVDLIVGTSLGGYWAAEIGALAGVPAVSINPAVDPATSLAKYVGTDTDWYGNEYTLTAETVAAYGPFNIDGCTIVFCDLDDEVINAQETFEALAQYYRVVMFPGGSHRFEHMEEAIPFIRNHYESCLLTYGVHQ